MSSTWMVMVVDKMVVGSFQAVPDTPGSDRPWNPAHFFQRWQSFHLQASSCNWLLGSPISEGLLLHISLNIHTLLHFNTPPVPPLLLLRPPSSLLLFPHLLLQSSEKVLTSMICLELSNEKKVGLTSPPPIFFLLSAAFSHLPPAT